MGRRLSAIGSILLALPLSVGAQQGSPPASPAMTDVETLARAQALLDEGKEQADAQLLQQALDLVNSVLERDRLNIQANLLAGELLVAANQFNQARDYFKLVLDREELNFRANLGYGKILAANHLWRQAVAYLEKAETVAAGAERIVDIKTALAFTYAGMGDIHRAIEKAAEAVRTDPADLDALQTLVEIHVEGASRMVTQAESAVQETDRYATKAAEAARAAPSDRTALTRLERAYNLQMAALRDLHNSFYQRNVRNEPTTELLPGKGVEAAAALNRMVKVMANQADLRRILTDHEALLLAEKAVEYDPANIKCLEELATLYHRTSRPEKARQTCEQILKLNPNHTGAQQYLGTARAQDTNTPWGDGSEPN